MTSAQRQLLAWASEGFFPGEPLGDFSNNCLGESKVVKIVFYHQSKLRKQPFFANFFKILSLIRRPCLEGRAEDLWRNTRMFPKSSGRLGRRGNFSGGERVVKAWCYFCAVIVTT